MHPTTPLLWYRLYPCVLNWMVSKSLGFGWLDGFGTKVFSLLTHKASIVTKFGSGKSHQIIKLVGQGEEKAIVMVKRHRWWNTNCSLSWWSNLFFVFFPTWPPEVISDVQHKAVPCNNALLDIHQFYFLTTQPRKGISQSEFSNCDQPQQAFKAFLWLNPCTETVFRMC